MGIYLVNMITTGGTKIIRSVFYHERFLDFCKICDFLNRRNIVRPIIIDNLAFAEHPGENIPLNVQFIFDVIAFLRRIRSLLIAGRGVEVVRGGVYKKVAEENLVHGEAAGYVSEFILNIEATFGVSSRSGTKEVNSSGYTS